MCWRNERWRRSADCEWSKGLDPVVAYDVLEDPCLPWNLLKRNYEAHDSYPRCKEKFSYFGATLLLKRRNLRRESAI
jgi:hypothetical protein